MLNTPSWADALHLANTPREKAVILLQRAIQRTSKRLAAEDITEALQQLEHKATDAQALLDYYRLPFSMLGLRTAAQLQLDPTNK